LGHRSYATVVARRILSANETDFHGKRKVAGISDSRVPIQAVFGKHYLIGVRLVI
jgi:hypothetical protein